MDQKQELADAKVVPIHVLAVHLGLNVNKHDLGLASWRGDRHPSLQLFSNSNRWYDYGTGDHGDCIDLVRRIRGGGVGEAIRWMREQGLICGQFKQPATHIPTTLPQASYDSKDAGENRKKMGCLPIPPEDTEILNRLDIALWKDRRLRLRDLPPEIKPMYAIFPDGGRLSGLALQNISGGWEWTDGAKGGLKYSIGHKEFSIIGDISVAIKIVITESMLDFAALQMLHGGQKYVGLVLNSAAIAVKAVDWIKTNRPGSLTVIEIWTDSDPPGIQAAQCIRDGLKRIERLICLDMTPHIQGKDLCDDWSMEYELARTGRSRKAETLIIKTGLDLN